MRALGTGAVMAVLAPSMLIPAPAHASGQWPTTRPDAVTVRIDGREAHLDLAANDTDPEGDALMFAGIDQQVPGVGIVDNSKSGGPQDVVVFASTFPRPGDTSPVAPGTYVVTTYIYDGTNLVPSTLTITVLPAVMDSVRLTRKHHPGRAVVRNDLDTPIRFVWGAVRHKRADGRVDVPAHSSRTIRVERRSLLTVALTGTDYGFGSVRHLDPPHDGTAVAPGLPPGYDVLLSRETRWVRRALAS